MVAVFFLSSRSGFWGGYGLMVYAHFGVAGGALHFHVFYRSKNLKIFYI